MWHNLANHKPLIVTYAELTLEEIEVSMPSFRQINCVRGGRNRSRNHTRRACMTGLTSCMPSWCKRRACCCRLPRMGIRCFPHRFLWSLDCFHYWAWSCCTEVAPVPHNTLKGETTRWLLPFCEQIELFFPFNGDWLKYSWWLTMVTISCDVGVCSHV
jgi:hypothetical protein